MKGWKLSTDYALLWELINKDIRVPAWVVNSVTKKGTIWDIVEVKKILNSYNIGSRGISYSAYDKNKLDFAITCKIIKLKFIMPNNI